MADWTSLAIGLGVLAAILWVVVVLRRRSAQRYAALRQQVRVSLYLATALKEKIIHNGNSRIAASLGVADSVRHLDSNC